ncbi:hypothetical protein [Nostoc sp.]|uniref:hypothetical protein n=1 Tax=Nostoc sp. TaxID=1180 RepID=UPI002FF9FAE9
MSVVLCPTLREALRVTLLRRRGCANSSRSWGASALGRQRRGRVSRLEATVVGSADLKQLAWKPPWR